MSEPSKLCPACGFENDDPPWANGAGSHEICPSCGIQFGYDDTAGGDPARRVQVHAEWRGRWVRDGMQWYSTGRKKPLKWDPAAQLRRLTETRR